MPMSPTRLFQNLRLKLLQNSMRVVMSHSWLRVATIGFCCLLIWGLLFGLSWKGFHELRTRWEFPLNGRLIELPFNMLFFTLTVMLVFSTGIILYSSLFSSPESQFLLAAPVPDDHIVAYKFQGAVAFSSWAFVLLASPILIAFGMHVNDGAPWYFYAAMPLFFLGFVLLPGAIGAVLVLLMVNLVPRHKKQIFVGLGLVVVALLVWWGVSWYRSTRGSGLAGDSKAWFDSFLQELSIFREELMPFQWMTQGLKAAALHQPGKMAYYLALIWSNGLFFYVVTLWLAKHLYRRGFNRVASGGTLRRQYGGQWLDHLLDRVLFFLDAQTRLLVVKDFRTFRRDPAQWAQILIFMALGTLYFFNMRRFYEQDIGRHFKNGISLLTLCATAFLMCAYTGRFIFPLLSLEGRKFWILGLLPFDRSKLVWGKFAFSASGCFLAGEFLVVFSNLMLGMPWIVVVLHALTIGLLALGFSGLSVGLGACMPNFRETDPSKIAVGFGGTLNLVAGLLMLLVLVSLMALPLHLIYAGNPDQALPAGSLPWWVWVGFLAGAMLGAVFTLLPLRAGVKQLRAMEF